MRLPLNARSLARLAQLSANAQAAQTMLATAISALCDHADIDAATVTDFKLDGTDLVLTLKEPTTDGTERA